MISRLLGKLKKKLRPKRKIAAKKTKKRLIKKRQIKRKARPAKAAFKKRSKAKVKKSGLKSKRLKRAKKKAAPKGEYVPSASERLIGEITHYFPKVSAAVFVVSDSGLKSGDTVKIVGHTTNFSQQVASMQIDRKPIEIAQKGDEIGLAVSMRVRKKDKVYKQI